jgi:hypothetical protein
MHNHSPVIDQPISCGNETAVQRAASVERAVSGAGHEPPAPFVAGPSFLGH